MAGAGWENHKYPDVKVIVFYIVFNIVFYIK